MSDVRSVWFKRQSIHLSNLSFSIRYFPFKTTNHTAGRHIVSMKVRILGPWLECVKETDKSNSPAKAGRWGQPPGSATNSNETTQYFRLGFSLALRPFRL